MQYCNMEGKSLKKGRPDGKRGKGFWRWDMSHPFSADKRHQFFCITSLRAMPPNLLACLLKFLIQLGISWLNQWKIIFDKLFPKCCLIFYFPLFFGDKDKYENNRWSRFSCNICSHYTCLNALSLLCEREIERQKWPTLVFGHRFINFSSRISSHYQIKSRHKIFGAKYISLTLSNCLWIFVRAVFFVYWPGLRIPTIFLFWIQIKACLHPLQFHFTPLLFFFVFLCASLIMNSPKAFAFISGLFSETALINHTF